LTPPQLRRVRVGLSKLPAAMSGTRLVQITDLHVGQMIQRDYVADIVRRTNELSPDLVVITGDLVDGTPEHLGEFVEPLAQLRAPRGVFFVTGNHEYYAGVLPWLELLPKLGIRILRNERVSVGEGADVFDLAGVDDSTGGRFLADHGADIPRALAGRDASRELVLLAHQPKEIYTARDHGVGLQISGHTHGGQVWPFTWLAHLIFPVAHGLARFGDTQIYVSRGTGYVGAPIRLGAPSELTEIELVRAEPGASQDPLAES
jgi:predicted MPP superfamily phosphohydrolase